MSNTEHPQHYNATKYEVWDVLDAWFPTNPLLWQVGKYIARADRKGAPVEDLEKAKAYLQREIDRRKREANGGIAVPTCTAPNPIPIRCLSCGSENVVVSQSRANWKTFECAGCGAKYTSPE